MKWQQKTLHAAISSLQGVSTSITSFALNNIPEKKAEKRGGRRERVCYPHFTEAELECVELSHSVSCK